MRALSLDDAVGLKARAWHDRFVIRDIIDLHAAADAFSYADIDNLARRHDPDLDLGTILEHLAGVSVFADEDFAEYGLDDPAIVSLRGWATGWYDDLARRLGPCRGPEDDCETCLHLLSMLRMPGCGQPCARKMGAQRAPGVAAGHVPPAAPG